MTKFYVAGSAATEKDVYDAAELIRVLMERGWQCTFNWPEEEDNLVKVFTVLKRWYENPDISGFNAEDAKKAQKMVRGYAELCRMGVKFCDVLIGILPGRIGTPWEIGMADAWRKRIILLDPDYDKGGPCRIFFDAKNIKVVSLNGPPVTYSEVIVSICNNWVE